MRIVVSLAFYNKEVLGKSLYLSYKMPSSEVYMRLESLMFGNQVAYSLNNISVELAKYALIHFSTLDFLI